MPLRSLRERILQTFAFEAGGVCVATPFVVLATDAAADEAGGTVIALAVCAVIWAPLYNTAFDWSEWRLARRLASDRPQALRIVHATLSELGLSAICIPVLMVATGMGLAAALLVDLGLTVLYVGYGYVFHLTYDRLRPVRGRRDPTAG